MRDLARHQNGALCVGREMRRRDILLDGALLLAASTVSQISSVTIAEAQSIQSQSRLPNIIIIWGDDIGWFNVSAFNRGMTGYPTPNIDRLAKEGALFTDWYGQQNRTAGCGAFITGQSPSRTGLINRILPRSSIGLQAADPTIAELLKPLGYMTAHYGQSHLGDHDEHLPTAHGFDEFFGNLYDLNIALEPEDPDYPKNPDFKRRYGPRGVIKSIAHVRIEDTGPLTNKRMETIDDDFTAGALNFVDRASRANRPFFLWWNSTHMNVLSRLKPESRDKSGAGLYADGMIEHDAQIGQFLRQIDDLGISGNTIIMYSTANGAAATASRDSGSTPFRVEMDSNSEGGYRVPTLIRWPNIIRSGLVYNEVFSHEDMLPTLLAAAGVPDIKERLLSGHRADGKTFKVHLDGYNLMPFLSGDVKEPPRHEFLYFDDDGALIALRFDNWKYVFGEPSVKLHEPKVLNLKQDPFERVPNDGPDYKRWIMEHSFLLRPAETYLENFASSLIAFPPRQNVVGFNLDQVSKELRSDPNERQ